MEADVDSMSHLPFSVFLAPSECLLCCFPSFHVQNTDYRSNILSTPPQSNNTLQKMEIQGCIHNFSLTTMVNLLSKITLRIQFSPLIYSPVSTSAIFACTSTVYTRTSIAFVYTSTILHLIDTRVLWVPIFNHYCILPLLMLFVASVLGYYCKAMTSHPECGSAPKAQCSSHKVVVRGRRVTAEIFENSTVAYSSSCDCVYCTPNAYELNTPLARTAKVCVECR